MKNLILIVGLLLASFQTFGKDIQCRFDSDAVSFEFTGLIFSNNAIERARGAFYFIDENKHEAQSAILATAGKSLYRSSKLNSSCQGGFEIKKSQNPETGTWEGLCLYLAQDLSSLSETTKADVYQWNSLEGDGRQVGSAHCQIIDPQAL